MLLRKSWRWLVLGLIAIGGVRLAAIEYGPPPPHNESQLPGLMLAKLANTQRLVAGLVSKDFGEIKRGADDMLRVCDAEQWESNPDPVYKQYRSELRRQALRLSELAEMQNLEGSAFSYIQTVSTCISCHEHCRDVLRIAQVPIGDHSVISIPTNDQDARWTGMPTLRR